MALHVVLGKGAVGATLVRHLLTDGHDVRVLSRSNGGAEDRQVEHQAVDASDAAALTRAAAGADVLHNCANPAYDRWTTDWPPVAAALLTAAERTGAVLVTVSNLYGYGPVDGPMTEDLPLAGTDTKARVRARMWQDALAAHQAGRVRIVEVRGSDFLGPRVVSTGHLADRVVPRLLAGRRSVSVLGDPDVPHTFSYVPDVARTLAAASQDPAAWGRAWHVPSTRPVTRREAVHGLCAAAGVEPVAVRSVPWAMVRALGVVQPVMRELAALRYQWERPYVLDSDASSAALGVRATPQEQQYAETVAWWRERELTAA